jgi:1-deoxy-D-xylulose-5-phosphate synthase
MAEWRTELKEIPIGTGRKLRDGNEIAILSLGHPGNFAASAIRDLRAEGISPAHFDMRFAKPLDEQLLHEALGAYPKIITVEDGTVRGGFGSAVLEFMNEHGYKNDVRMLGIPDLVVEHGTPKELQRECGFDAAAIAEAVREMVSDKSIIKTMP